MVHHRSRYPERTTAQPIWHNGSEGLVRQISVGLRHIPGSFVLGLAGVAGTLVDGLVGVGCWGFVVNNRRSEAIYR